MRLLFLIVACLGLAACGGAPKLTAGDVCTTDMECATGLTCQDFASFAADGGCSIVDKACTKTCTGDGDCTALGPKFRCFAGCGGPSVCGETL